MTRVTTVEGLVDLGDGGTDAAGVHHVLVATEDGDVLDLRFAPATPRRAERHHLGVLPVDLAPRSVGALRLQSLRVLGEIRLNDAARLAADPAEASKLFRAQQQHLALLSDELNHIYFSHAESR